MTGVRPAARISHRLPPGAQLPFDPEDPSMPSAHTESSEASGGPAWKDAWAQLDGLPGGGLNICHETLDRHADGGAADRVALRWLARDGTRTDTTYGELRDQAARFAGLLKELGVGPGDRVCSLTGRIPELFVAALGTVRLGAVFCPLYSALGPEPVHERLSRSGARVLITAAAQRDRKIAGIRDRLPQLEHVLCVDDDLPARLAAARPAPVNPTRPDDPALLHFTSGTTGAPKGALHAHRAVVAHHTTARHVLDLHDGDIYWCTADPGWVTGMSYGVIGPLSCGVTLVVDEAEFDATRWYDTLAREAVNVWYTAPTALRMLVHSAEQPREGRDLSALRLIASVGEPLPAETVRWGDRAFGLPVHDTWWQTESGAIMIASDPHGPVRPGAIGRAVAGIEAAIARRDETGAVVVGSGGQPELLTDPGAEGEIVLRAGWPSMFLGYLDDAARTRRCFVGDWYLSGDLARCDEDGWFWFVGRGDDVIKTAGHLVGPFEVESTLIEHPAVAEAAVIGIPDEVAGQLIIAKVVLLEGIPDTPELRREIRGFARKQLGAAIAPRRVDVIEELPHTRSGKVMRRLLRARELGEAEGDLSMLEPHR